MTVMGIIMVMPVIMVPVVIVPVVSSPGTPVPWIVTPVPGRPPYHISGMVDIPDQWPRGNIIIGRGDHIYISPIDLPCISRISCFGIDRFNDIVRAIK
jgi:hypothetical protein